MNNLAVITARSGSKGLKDKNIKELCGKPLMAYTIEAAITSNCFQKVMVSTDSELYADIAIKYGAEVPFLRSSEASSDTAGSWEVVDEVLQQYASRGEYFDTVCLLQPTSPLREAGDIRGGYQCLIDKCADAITSVCKADHPINLYMQLPKDNSLTDYRKQQGYYLPRQQQGEYYRINGALYIRRIQNQQSKVEMLKAKEYAYEMDKLRSVDIDSIEDFLLASFYLQTKS